MVFSTPTIRNLKRRPWFEILRDLKRAGVSMHQVARTCGKTVKTVSHWADGGQPKDLDARIVLCLYRNHCPEEFCEHVTKFGIENMAASNRPIAPPHASAGASIQSAHRELQPH